MKERIAAWRREVETDNETFKAFYLFVFDYLRGEKKILCKHSVFAVTMWYL